MINKVILMGRMTRDPELRHTGKGTPVTTFSIAIDNGYGDNKRLTTDTAITNERILSTVLRGTKPPNL